MSTYMAKAGQVDRKWYVIDAAGKPLGRVAAQVAVLLRGKHKPIFTPHVDCGNFVIVINKAPLSCRITTHTRHLKSVPFLNSYNEMYK